MTDIDEWDGQFITVDQEMLFEIILAANYLNIQPLMYVYPAESTVSLVLLTRLCSDLGCKTVANMIEGKTPEEIRKLFNIVDDSIPEEEEGIRKAMPVPEEEIHDPIPAPEEETSDPIPAPEVKIRDTIPAPEEEASDTILAPEEEVCDTMLFWLSLIVCSQGQMRAENVSPLMSKTGFLSKWRSWLRRKRVRVCG